MHCVLCRSVFDVLPTAALVSMSCCAVGSARGPDELVPHHVHVVSERRLYRALDSATGTGTEPRLAPGSALLAARRLLNELHHRLAADGYTEVSCLAETISAH